MIETCRRCNGSGHYEEIGGTASFRVTCPICGGAGYTGTGSPSKTLLDEFAMAAMCQIIAKRPYIFAEGEKAIEDALRIVRGDCRGAYEYAAAMMKERARRDEMGNVKEVK